jgi:hypothetical protein
VTCSVPVSRDDDSDFGKPDRDQVTRLRVDVRYLSGAIQKLEDHVKDIVTKHDERIRKLEDFRWWIVGALFGSGALYAIVSKLMEKL